MQSNRTRYALRALYFLILSVVFFGCAKPPLPDLIWPTPPDIPRIKFVKTIASESDMTKPNIFEQILLGSEKGSVIRKPWGVALNSKGLVYVTDTGNPSFFIFDLEKEKIFTATARGMTKPTGIAIDASDKVFVSDTVTNSVYVFDNKGKEIGSLVPPKGDFKNPAGLAVDNAQRRIYVVDAKNYDIKVFDTETLAYIKTIGGPGKGNGQFNMPQFVSVDAKGNIVVTDTMNGRIQILDPNGKFIRKFGELGDIPGMFARPKGNAVDSEGHIYVVDAAFANVQIFNDEGQILMAFSYNGTGRGELSLPAGIYIDKDDFIYIADQMNRRIQMYEYLGEKHKAREALKEAMKLAGEGKGKKVEPTAAGKPAAVKEEPKVDKAAPVTPDKTIAEPSKAAPAAPANTTEKPKTDL